MKQNNRKLNQAQSEAAAHFQGPCLVLAGPGSGKTLVIVKRIETLLKKYKVKPEEILVITFTKYAAKEMKERFYRLMGVESCPVTFGTFHGIYYGILKWAYRLNPGNLLSEEEKYQLLGEVAGQYDLVDIEEHDFLKDLAAEIGIVKNSRIPIEEYESARCPSETFRSIFADYEKKRKELRKLDFDDMLTVCCSLFESRPDILAKWQDRYHYILIDEFQDINQVQYDVIKMLAAPQNHLFAVGDDDQSIYGFRGAKSDLMFQFEKDFPGAKRILLDVNYRSTGNIVRVCSRVIAHNQVRFPKQIHPFKTDGKNVHVQEVKDPQEEAKYIAGEIKKRLKAGVSPKKIAVLFRVHTESQCLAEVLTKQEIPFWMREQFFNIYTHFIGENISAYFRLALGGRQRADFLNVMNRPKRYISRESLEGTEISFESLRRFYCDKTWMLDRIDQLDVDLRMMKRMTPYGAIQYLRKSIGYDEFLKEYAGQTRQSEEELFDLLAELEQRSKAFQTLEEWLSYVREYTEMLMHQKQKMAQNQGEGIRLMTMHSAKGLEFDTVFLPGINEGMMPYRKMHTKEEVEEERRLFYVGMTRAKEELLISYAVEKNGKELNPSRFIAELFVDDNSITHK